MKRIVIFLLCLSYSVITFGQEKMQNVNGIKGETVQPSSFTGAKELGTLLNNEETASLNQYLQQNIKYPELSKKMLQEGTEVIQFVVSPRGEVTDFKVINSVSPEIDQEVIRVLKTTNKMWKPGTYDGDPISIVKEVSIAFNNMNASSGDFTDFISLAKCYFDKGNKKFFVVKNNRSAIKNYDKAIRYLPNDKSLLVTRGMCKYELGDKNGACRDWNRIKTLGGLEGDAYLNNFCDYKGFADLISILQEKE